MLAGDYPGIQILFLRRQLRELRDNHIVPMMQTLAGIARYNKTENVFTFPNGSRIIMAYCANEIDALIYQGQSYDVIFMEEATQFTEQQMIWITSASRPTKEGFSPRVYYTCNPGGVGHTWVKRLFIDRQYRNSERPEDYVFIQAKVRDNYVLMQRDPDYIRILENMPPDMRRAHLDGDWDIFTGQYFGEFRREIHTCDPFPIPAHWTKYRSIDYGLDMLACLWEACDELGNIYVYNELYEPNKVISEAVRGILDRSSNETCTYAPADMWGRNRDSGKAQADLFAEYGLPLVKVQNGRVDGWMNLKEWLKPVPDGTGANHPRLRIFSNCVNLIRCIPMLQHDDKNPSDCATEPHEITHAPDALRYFLDGRPRPAEIIAPKDDDRPGIDDQIDNFMDWGR